MSNGLCYLENAEYYGRYTCTDQSWQSGSCPEICTNGNTASGNEAVLQCGDGSWCCDGDRSFNCCTTADTSFFALPQGNQVAFISSVPSPSPVASPASSNSPASASAAIPTSPSTSAQSPTASSSSVTTTPQSTSSTLSTATTTNTPTSQGHSATSTFTSKAVTTGSNGAVSTIILVSVATVAPTAAPSSHSSSSESSHLGLIIGLAVGIPVLLLACAIVAFILWKRRRASRKGYASPPPDSPTMTDKYGHQVGHVAPDGQAPELDSFPVALRRSKSGHKSELEGSSGLLHSPAPSTGTGPPQYSQNSPRSPALHSVQEEVPQEPQELWGGYVPYRPPRTELPTPEQQGANE
ncbi:hypothetical protein LTR08_004903 [Meristemomyces frigidus]|nr:hypothetical protein LTR08_004903 [Meristemomyces frigidus]